MAPDPKLDLARRLLDVGAGASSRAALAGVRTVEANDLRERSTRMTLSPGVYALGALPTGFGTLLPLRPRLGAPRLRDPSARAACAQAKDVVRALFGTGGAHLPELRFDGDDRIPLEGASLGLPAALAYALHYAGLARGAVLASGALRADGHVDRVVGLHEKLTAAAEERGVRVVFVPADADVSDAVHDALGSRLVRVASLSDALAELGIPQPVVASTFLDGDVQRAAALELPDGDAIEALLALRHASAYPADRTRLDVDLAARLRHLGRSAEAADAATRLLETLAEERLGASLRETLELHYWLGRMDLFALDAAREGLERMLARGIAEPMNEIRVRGALAQALGMAGAFEEAYETRRKNLTLHALSAECAKGAPGTLSVLALDAARIGRAREFDAHLAEFTARHPGDVASVAFGASAFVRGSVLLGRFQDVASWFDAKGTMACPFPRALADGITTRALTSHPEVSLVRALVRALGELGRADDALALAACVVPERDSLRGFLAHLVDIEAGMVAVAAGRRDEGAARIASAQVAIRAAHGAAVAHHEDLLADDPRVLRRAIDRVWY